MKVIDPGHSYYLETFNGGNNQELHFIKRFDGQLMDGVTNEEVLAVLIDRMKHLQNKFPCQENEVALINLETALQALNTRTQKRVAQGVEGKDVAHV